MLVTKECNDLIAARDKNPRRPKDPKERDHNHEKTPRDTDSHQFAMAAATSRPGNQSPFPTDCVLLDSESTESIFCEASLLTNLRDADTPLTLQTNGGKHTARQIGDYHGLLGWAPPSPSGTTLPPSPTS